ncbi:pneumococcal-type histidine triad protein [Streptococcus sp. zg-86]|uniref:Pneumococcal-type histidine triad protein n=1 Tax=Streptococcus zhangguiae TaxID=2664091 RepID=A0ABW9R3K6_9STRE|nr:MULTISPECIES: pneumococcal-type histidine triad protein [unclassified Streptococcus]MTB64639.1 pneumococcal-type histidine triad protein [Streptococcus sp. zg-86]MTB90949.1 pneumococcal-type histidine triad protein [Streptococcus sp. zg-36]
MKKKYIIGSVAAIALSLCSYELGRHQAFSAKDSHRVAYVDQQASPNNVATKAENLTPEQINAKENIKAEQIVIKITDQGYVTSHGDHYHYYNGKVPFDAIISEELIMKDPAYQLQDADIVNEVKDGYIIKVNGTYYLYLKDPAHTTNVRTKAEIARQREEHLQSKVAAGESSRFVSQEVKAARAQGRYTTDDGYVFNPTDVIEDTGDAFIVPHGNHFHYIPKSDLSPSELAAAQNYWNSKKGEGIRPSYEQARKQGSNPVQIQGLNTGNPSAPTIAQLLQELYATPLSERHVETDGLVFDPAQITRRTDSGVVVPHGDHFHFIPYSQMSALEAQIAQAIAIGKPIEHGTNGIVPAPETKPINATEKPTSPQRHNGPYTTDDGYVFSPTDVIKDFGDSFLVPHGNHFHFIPKSDLSASELSAAQSYWDHKNGTPTPTQANPIGGLTPSLPEKPVPSQPSIQEKSLSQLLQELYATPLAERHVETDGLVFDPAQIIRRTEDGVAVPHGDHFHFILYSQMSPLEAKIARMIGIGTVPTVVEPLKPLEPETKPVEPTQPVKPEAPASEKQPKKTMYSQKELDAAKAEGRYISAEDGYIFKAEDIISDEGESYIIFRDNYTHWVDKESLSEKELAEAEAFCKEKGLTAPSADDVSYFDASKESADSVFERVAAKKVIPFERLPYNIGYASEVKKGKIIIPHRDHYHNLTISWFNDSEFFKAPSGYSLEDLFATVKYYLAHPEDRPYSQYGWGSVEEESKPETPVASESKPTEIASHPEREGKPNSQIVYTPEEIVAAKAAGRYTTSDGYIFDAKDIVEDLDDGYLVPHMTHSHYIPKKDLSEKEQEEARQYVDSAGLNKKTETKPTNPTKETALAIYNRVAAEKIVPVEAMPYNSAYVVDFQNGQMIIPHYDHYHNVSLSWFDDDLYHAPEGYTLEQFLATVKYYVTHPEDRPVSDDGFGSASEHGTINSSDTAEEEAMDYEPDEEELEQQRLAKEYGMSVDDFQDKLVTIALKYKVAMDSFSYQPEQKTVSLVTKDGQTVLVSLESLEELPVNE